MQNFAVMQVLSTVIATEPGTSYFLIVKFLTESGFEDNLRVMASECSADVLDKQKLKWSSAYSGILITI